MAKTVNQGFEEFLDDLRPTQAHRDAAASHRASVKAALESHFRVDAFFESGSFTHGTGVRYFSDVDSFVRIGLDRPVSSDTALGWVSTALTRRFPSTVVKIRRPAVVIEFASGTESWEIIPAFYRSGVYAVDIVYDIPGPSSGWMQSAPKAHLEYVNDKNAKPKPGCAKALARLLKAWKYYMNVPISSFYLEMRAAQHVGTQQTYIHVWDLKQVLNSLDDDQLAGMNDPRGMASRFYPCSSEARKEDALSKLRTARIRADKALDATNRSDDDTAFHNLNLLFGGQFPAR